MNARWFAALKVYVFPLFSPTLEGDCDCGRPQCGSIGKHPRCSGGLNDATPSPERIDAWWNQWPDANLGVRTGIESGLVVVDVDPRHGGNESLVELEQKIGVLPKTWKVVTGGGGSHLYFRHPGGKVGNRTGFLPGLDLRGDGGYAVGPGSLHGSGRRYEWDAAGHPAEVPLASMPQNLLEFLRGGGARTQAIAVSRGEWIPDILGGISEGKRNQALTSLFGHLLRRYVEPRVALTLVHAFNRVGCRPPLPEDEVVRISESIAKAERRRRKDKV